MSDQNGDEGTDLGTIQDTLSTLGARIDSLVTSTTSYQSALTDRLTEYADLVTKLTRAQASELEEYRRASERTLVDLRRGLAAAEETMDRVGTRVESMLGDAEATDDQSRRALSEVRSILDAQENLGRFLTESLDQLGAQVSGRLDGTEQTTRTQIETLTQELRAQLTEVRGDFDVRAVTDQITRLEDELASSGKITTETYGELAGLRAKVDSILEVTAKDSATVSRAVDEMREALLDVASGEVVGSLWDEFRQLRATVEALVDHTGATADPEAVEALRTDVTSLTDSVRTLLEQAEVVDEGELTDDGNAYLVALAADVAALREELAEGMEVEPSEALVGTVDALRTELGAIGDRLVAVDGLRAAVDELRANGDPTPAAAAPDPAVAEALQGVRAGLDEIRAQLDEGLVVSTEDAPPAAGVATDEVAELADQVATLRDLVRTEFDALRQDDGTQTGAEPVDLTPLTARLDRLHDDIVDRQELADDAPVDLGPVLSSLDEVHQSLARLLDRAVPATAGAQAAPETAVVDPDVIDVLREEIRAAGTVSDDLVEALRTELVALRRRIRLRAEGEIFSDDQLRLIADAVAERLAE